MSIHPSAVIAEGAVVPDSCEVGPFATIGPDVVLGEDCRLISHVVLDGPPGCCKLGELRNGRGGHAKDAGRIGSHEATKITKGARGIGSPRTGGDGLLALRAGFCNCTWTA